MFGLWLLVQIPVGARFVGIPGTESEENPTGLMVEVYWEQDDCGALCISGHSTETPIPPSVQPMSSSAAARRRGFFGHRGPVHGVVLNPNLVLGHTADDHQQHVSH